MLRKSDTLYYGVKGASMQKSTRTEKKINHDLIPVPYRTAKAFEPAIYRNVAYDVYMNDHFKKYFDKNLLKQHPHIPFMTHNRLIERFGTYFTPSSRNSFGVFVRRGENAFACDIYQSTGLSTSDCHIIEF